MLKRNSRKPAFTVGERVRFLQGGNDVSYTVTWVQTKAATRGEQLIALDGHSHSADASLFTEAT